MCRLFTTFLMISIFLLGGCSAENTAKEEFEDAKKLISLHDGNKPDDAAFDEYSKRLLAIMENYPDTETGKKVKEDYEKAKSFKIKSLTKFANSLFLPLEDYRLDNDKYPTTWRTIKKLDFPEFDFSSYSGVHDAFFILNRDGKTVPKVCVTSETTLLGYIASCIEGAGDGYVEKTYHSKDEIDPEKNNFAEKTYSINDEIPVYETYDLEGYLMTGLNKLYPLYIGYATGYIDNLGNVKIEPLYGLGSEEFSEGLASVDVNDSPQQHSFIDEKGTVVIENKNFGFAHSFSEGLAGVTIKGTNGKCGYIAKDGEIQIKPNFDSCYDFKDGFGRISNGGKEGFIDRTGNYVVEPVYDGVTPFSEGLSRVMLGKKYGYVNKDGKEIIPLKYDDASVFSDGLAAVKLNNQYGYINKEDKAIIDFVYDKAKVFQDGLALVKEDDYWGFIDRDNTIIFNFKSEDAMTFSEGIARFKVNGRWGALDKNGDIVINPIYKQLGDFNNGIALMMLPKKGYGYGYIDKKGNIIANTKTYCGIYAVYDRDENLVYPKNMESLCKSLKEIDWEFAGYAKRLVEEECNNYPMDKTIKYTKATDMVYKILSDKKRKNARDKIHSGRERARRKFSASMKNCNKFEDILK